jgi:hypothetical protein
LRKRASFLFFQEEADKKRREEFKRYEMEKKFEHDQVRAFAVEPSCAYAFEKGVAKLRICTYLPWRCGLGVPSTPATEDTGAMDREIESRQGIGW